MPFREKGEALQRARLAGAGMCRVARAKYMARPLSARAEGGQRTQVGAARRRNLDVNRQWI
jgi:hypothetical protein